MILNNLRCEYLVKPLGIDRTAPRLSWELISGVQGDLQTAYQIQAGSTVGANDLWDTGKVTSSAQNQITYVGTALTSRKAVYWQVRVWDVNGVPSQYAASLFEIGLLNTSDWGAAQWVGYQTGPLLQSSPSPHVRKTFTTQNKTVQRARLYASALGVYRPFLNGSRVGQFELAPGWTDFTQRRQYQTYDVTSMVVANGRNALGLALGDGWFLGNMSIYTNPSAGNNRDYYGVDVPRGLAALYIDYTDGTGILVVSDGSWTAITSSNLSNDIYNGSPADGRQTISFTNPTLDDSGWPAVSAIALGSVPLVAQMSQPIKKHKQLAAVSRVSPTAGTYIFDMGQNHSGIPTLKVVGASNGTVVTMKHGEDLVYPYTSSSTLYTGNLRNAAATDTYTCMGQPVEYFEPLHTWHGYRYIQLTGYPGVPPMDAVVSSVLHTDAQEAGTFTCSNSVIANIWKAATWTFRSNMITIPTDCNQRDERLGWTNDAQISSAATVWARDYAAFYSKFCDDLDSGESGGNYPDVAPYVSVAGRGNAAWGDAGIIIPWAVYQAYGDTAILSRHYANMTAALNKLPYSSGYGDYLNLNDPTDGNVFRYAWAYRCATIMQQVATILGDATGASTAASKAASFALTFTGYVASDGTVLGNSQSGYILGLAFGLIPFQYISASLAKLVALLAANNMTCGFVGLAFLPQVLADNGRLDLAYRYISQTIYPSWGYDLSLGMTTMGENWKAPTRQGGGDQANSYNHPMRGAVAAWIMNAVAGINFDPASPGGPNYILRPRLGGGVTWANGSFAGMRGTVQCQWAVTAFGFEIHASVPANCTATITIPPGYTKPPMVGQLALSALTGVSTLSADPITGGQRFSIPSGAYDIFIHA